MRRRTLVMTGTTIVLGSITGCLGSDDDQQDSTPTPTVTSEKKSSEGSAAEEISFSVESSADEIEWGEEYSVSVTVEAGDEPPRFATRVLYQPVDDGDWRSFENTTKVWRLDAGESTTETFDIEPPTVGEFTVGLVKAVEGGEGEVVEEWALTVNTPVQSFGEPLSYFDGLDLTIEVGLHEWLEFELFERDEGEEAGMYSVRPEDGQWVKVNIIAENTNQDTEVGIPRYEAFSALAGNSQFDHPRYLGEKVGGDTGYVVDNRTRHEKGGWVEMNDGGEPGQEGFWLPKDDLVPTAVEEGWLLFETDTDTSVEDVAVQLQRNDVLATWE